MPELVESSALRARLGSELMIIAAEFRDHLAAVEKEYPIEPIWAEVMNEPGFRISLWASQRVAYMAFYNAYEAFVVGCLKVGTGRSQLRASDKKMFNEALRSALSKDVFPAMLDAPGDQYFEVGFATRSATTADESRKN